MAKTVPASMRTRESLADLIEGRLSSADGRAELVKLATRLIVWAALEAEIRQVEGGGEGIVAVPATVHDRVRQTHVPPHQVERLGGIFAGDPFHDGRTVEAEFVDEIPAFLRIESRARLRDRRHSLPDLPGELCGAFPAGKLEL